MLIVLCLTLHPFCTENNESILSAVPRNRFPLVMKPLSHLSPIDFQLDSTLQGVRKQENERSSDKFRFPPRRTVFCFL